MKLISEELSYTWREREGSYPALQGFSSEFQAGVPHILCGASGSGKTTLGLLLAGLKNPDQGRALLNDEAIAVGRPQAAFVFQFPETLFFADTVREEFRDIFADQKIESEERYFAEWGLNYEEIAEKNPFHLSAGISRLVAIALQMAREPNLLILDEPTIGLDEKRYSAVLSVLKKWINPERIMIIITHDLDVMAELGGHAWALFEGRLAWNGLTSELLEDEQRLREFNLLA